MIYQTIENKNLPSKFNINHIYYLKEKTCINARIKRVEYLDSEDLPLIQGLVEYENKNFYEEKEYQIITLEEFLKSKKENMINSLKIFQKERKFSFKNI